MKEQTRPGNRPKSRTIQLYPDAADAVGISKSGAYAAAKTGWLIVDRVPILRVGGQWLVPVTPLAEWLGIEDEDDLRSRCIANEDVA